MEQTVQQFLDQLSKSGLLSDADLAALRDSVGDAPETLAEVTDTLVKQRKLTKFQADQISKGKGARLVLGNYLLVDEIGAGGMGKVYLAEHRRMKRRVALKTLPPAMIEDQQAVERFQREVQAAAQLTHPNIVTAYDADEANGMHYFVMEYVEGADLRRLVASRGPLSIAQAVECVKQVAEGLDYAHRKGIVHRDIKPGNLLLNSEGMVKILDMGLARYQTSGEGDAGLTISGMAMGTADFMAPEQGFNAKSADARSDIYSLGCTLYSLLTGSKVYEGESIIEKIMAHQQQPIPDLSATRADVPSELAGIFNKMVAKQPEQRFQTAAEVIESLTQISGLDGSSDSGLKSNTPLRALAADAFGPMELSPPPLNQSVTKTFVSSVYDDTVEQAPDAETSVTHPPKRRWGLIAAGLLGLVILFAGLIIKLRTPAGYVVLEIDQPEIVGAQVLIDGEESITIRTGNGEEQIRVTPDKERHQLDVQMAGFKTFTEEFTYDTGSKKKIKVTLVPLNAVANTDEEEVKPVVASSSDENWALEFDGKEGCVEIPTLGLDVSRPITLEASVQLIRLETQPSLNSFVLSTVTYPRTGDGFALYLTDNQLEWRFGRQQDDGWVERKVSATFRQRVNLAGIWDGKQLRFYLDGKQAHVKLGSYRMAVEGNAAAPVLILGRHLHGIIDEIRISNVARYTEDYAPKPRLEADEHTVALYHFDEGTGDVLTDSSGNGHDGKIVGAKWVRVDGELNVNGEDQAANETTAYVWPNDQPAPAIAPFTAEEAHQHQEEWAKHLGVPVEMENTIGMKFRVIPPGEFLMGSSEEEIVKLVEEAKKENLQSYFIEGISQEGPQHNVVLTKPFGISLYEVTRGQFRQFVVATGYRTDAENDGEGGLGYKGGQWVQSPEFLWNTELGFGDIQTDSHPVVNVSWNDATQFCKWLSDKEKVSYRLPTAAEWESACRAGSLTRFHFGDDDSMFDDYGWSIRGSNYRGSFFDIALPVGQKKANPFGLFDMHGNVREWCFDGLRSFSHSTAVDPTSDLTGESRSLRGGAFTLPPLFARSAVRATNASTHRNIAIGFRIVRTFEKYDSKMPQADGPAFAPKPGESSEPEGHETR